jgi:hypothetical protein
VWPEVEFERPRRAVLLDEVPVAVGDRVGVEVVLGVVDLPVRRQDAAVDLPSRLRRLSGPRELRSLADDAGDVDSLRPEFPRHRLGHPAGPELRRRETDGALAAPNGGGRPGEDDRPRPGVEHVRDRLLGAVERAPDVRVERAVELVGVDLEGALPRRGGGGDDEGVDGAERLAHRLESTGDGRGVADVDGRRDRVVEFRGQRPDVLVGAGEQADRTPLGVDAPRQRRTQPRTDPAITAVRDISVTWGASDIGILSGRRHSDPA